MDKLKYWGKLLLILIFPFGYIWTELKKENKSDRYILIVGICGIFIFCIFWNTVFSDSTKELENEITENESKITEYEKANSKFADEVQDYQRENEKLKVDLKNANEYGKLTDAEKAEKEKAKEEAKRKAAENAAVAEKKMAEKADEKAYKDWIEKQFSAWDGSCKKLKDMTIQSLNDPDSFKHISTKYWEQTDKKSIIISMEFTAKNGFGGTIKSVAKGTLQRESDTLTNFEILN